MVASRDKAQQLAELRDLWTAGLIDGNEYRIDLKREPKPQYAEKTGGAPSPAELPPEAREALYNYANKGFEDLNPGLRNGALTPDSEGAQGDAVRALDSAIADAPPLSEDSIVYRGIPLHFDLTTGDTTRDPAFMSTSMTQSTSARRQYAGSEGSLWRILTPKGSRAAFVDLIKDSEEYELLFPRDARLKIASVRIDGRVQRIDAELIP